MAVIDHLNDLWIKSVSGRRRPAVIGMRPDIWDEAIADMPRSHHFVRSGEPRQHFLYKNAIAIPDAALSGPMAITEFTEEI